MTVSLVPYVSVAEGSSARVLLRLDIDNSGLLECPVEVDFTTIDATACKKNMLNFSNLSLPF